MSKYLCALRVIFEIIRIVEASDTAKEGQESDIVPIVLSILAGVFLAWFITRAGSGDPDVRNQMRPPPFTIQRTPTRSIRSITKEELARNNGRGDSKRIFIAVSGDVFDITSHPSGIELYGPEGTYASFAGKDATVGLALSSYDEEDFVGKTMNDPSIGWWERERLDEWYTTFVRKYDIVGQLVSEGDDGDGDDDSGSARTSPANISTGNTENNG